MVYYNDNVRFCTKWIENLISGSCLPRGDVDHRSITEVKPDEVKDYRQAHFFAGIGGWPLALQWAGWPQNRIVWTGSCPCQPFSSAGRRKDTYRREEYDERHLWPAFFRLIAECRPATIFGEQVASPTARDWMAAVRLDLESIGYAVGIAPLSAACVGAPHLRRRLFWVANARHRSGRSERSDESRLTGTGPSVVAGKGGSGHLDNPVGDGSQRRFVVAHTGGQKTVSGEIGPAGVEHLADASGSGPPRRHEFRQATREDVQKRTVTAGAIGSPGLVDDREGAGGCGSAEGGRDTEPGRSVPGNPFWEWDNLEWLLCADGKLRPTEPGLFPLADGIPGRVGRIRSFGNAIVPQVAAVFIQEFMEAEHEKIRTDR